MSNLDISAVSEAALDRIVSSGMIEKTIEKALLNTIQNSIESELSSYSAFGKKLTEKVKESIQINFEDCTLPTYNSLIMETIRSKVNDLMESQGRKEIEQRLTGMLMPAPEKLKLSELVEEFKKDVAYNDSKMIGKNIEYTLEPTTVTKSRWFNLSKPSDSKYDPEFSMLISEDLTIALIRWKKPQHYVFIGDGWYGFERRLWMLHAHGIKIELDVNNIDTEVHGDKDHCRCH